VGKAVSRFNALQPGIRARAYLISGEEAAELAAIVREVTSSDSRPTRSGVLSASGLGPAGSSRPLSLHPSPHQSKLTTSG
jgi:hypothetical protein